MPNFLINVTTRGVKGASSGIRKLSGSLLSLSKVAMVGATGGAIALSVAMNKATKAAAEQEIQETKLTAALGKNAQALIKQAGALQQTSRFGDEAIIQQQAYLASIGLTEAQIKEMIPVTLDLAAATGMSLESAVKNTAKTLSGMTGELGESVMPLRELTAEELKAGKGIEVMRKMFKGAAEVEIKTFAGAMDQAKNAMGDAAESLGKLLLPMATDGAKIMKKFSEDAIDAFDFIGKIDFGKTFENMKTNMGALQTLIVDSFKLAFGFLPDVFRFAMNKILPAAQKVLGLLFEGVKNVAGFLWEPIGIGIQIVIAKVKNFFIGMINFAKEQFNSLAEIANTFGVDIKPMEMSKLIDTEGLSMANSEMVQLFKGGAEDNINTLADLQQAQLELYKNYADAIIVENEKTETSNDKKTEKVITNTKKELTATEKTEQKKREESFKSAVSAGASASSALGAVRQVIKAKFAEMIAGLLAREITSKGFLGILTGAAMAGAASQLFEQVVPSFAQGGDFVTSGPQMMMVGDNPSGQERVQVTPLGGDPNINGPQGGGTNITLNISAPLVDDTVVDTIIPAINEAVRRGEVLAS